MTYGLETRDVNGDIEIEGYRKTTRLIRTLHVAWDFSGTISVPEFDDTIGAITFYPKAYAVSGSPIARRPYGYDEANLYQWWSSIYQMPTLAWNNTTKLLTVTPATNYGENRPDYVVNMIHYK